MSRTRKAPSYKPVDIWGVTLIGYSHCFGRVIYIPVQFDLILILFIVTDWFDSLWATAVSMFGSFDCRKCLFAFIEYPVLCSNCMPTVSFIQSGWCIVHFLPAIWLLVLSSKEWALPALVFSLILHRKVGGGTITSTVALYFKILSLTWRLN